jgi:hypothetical protein
MRCQRLREAVNGEQRVKLVTKIFPKLEARSGNLSRKFRATIDEIDNVLKIVTSDEVAIAPVATMREVAPTITPAASPDGFDSDILASGAHQSGLPRFSGTSDADTGPAALTQEVRMYVSTSMMCSSLKDG